MEHRRVPTPLAARAPWRLGDGAAARSERPGSVDRRRIEPRHLSELAAQGGRLATDRLPERAGDDAALSRADREPAAAAQRLERARARHRCAVAGFRATARASKGSTQ